MCLRSVCPLVVVVAGVMVCLCCLRGFWEKKFEFPYNFPYKYDTAPGNQNGDNRRQVRVSPRGFHGLGVWVVILICNPWVQIRRSPDKIKDYHGAAGTVWDGTGVFRPPQAGKFWAPVVNGTGSHRQFFCSRCDGMGRDNLRPDGTGTGREMSHDF